MVHHDFHRLQAPLRKHDDILPVILKRIWFDGVDDHRPIHPLQFLTAGVAVIPVGPALLDDETVVIGLSRLNTPEAHPRNSIHVRGQEDSVPVNRRVLHQLIRHADRDVLTVL